MSENTEGWGEPEQTEGAPVPAPAVSYPETPANPHNHRFTISVAGNGPHIVVRGNTAQEVNAGFQELLEANLGTLMGNFWNQVKAEGQVANGMGGATPVPPAPQHPAAQAPQHPMPPQQPGTAPAAWQNSGAPQGQQQGQWGGQQQVASPIPPGWYKLNVPFPQKPTFDGIVAQNNLRKADPSKGGQVSFQRATKSWYCDPNVAQLFGQFQPVPA